jgi:hypothetical protein
MTPIDDAIAAIELQDEGVSFFIGKLPKNSKFHVQLWRAGTKGKLLLVQPLHDNSKSSTHNKKLELVRYIQGLPKRRLPPT